MELFVKPFGKYAHGKKIPSFVFDLPVKQLKAFLDGYMAGDGCFTNKKFKATSVSRELIYGLAWCVAKVYKRPFSIYKTKRAETTVIEGRIVNQRDTYELTFNKENHVQDKAFYENGYVWYPFNKIKKAENEVVYDLTVSDNHSFVVNNAIVHNCQDFSTAGKQKGIYNADGSLTRSGLLKHVERLLTESVLYGIQPKYLLMENVKGLVSKKFKPDFLNWLDKLEQLGYNNYWQVLNAKDYGIPQNRERVFVVSIRKDIDTKGYKFPSPIPLKLRLKDMLELCVDEKYYLSDDKVTKIINQANMNLNKQTTAIISKQGTCLEKTTDTACSLMARDYKGFGNQGINGVIEPKIIERTPLKFLNRNGKRIDGDYAFCVDTSQTGGVKEIYDNHFRVRKLTPREYWRLMGFTNDEFDCAKSSGISNSQLYKQAGNSIVVDVLVAIFKNLGF